MRVCVIGGGSWGVSLANVLNDNKHDVSIYFRDKKQIDYIKENGKSNKYLKDFVFPKEIKLTNSISEAIDGSVIIVLATPLQQIVEVLEEIKPYLKGDEIIVDASKGIHFERLQTASEIVEDVLGNFSYAVISGPSHAEEVSKRMITTVACASKDEEVAKFVQDSFMTEYFRVYIHKDVLGVEVAGAIKNVIAIGAGVLTGLDQGDNAKAALITRGLFEMSKLGKSLGCNPLTFMGLAGMGDLIVTANSIHSRNFRAGLLIGKGVPINKLQEEIGETVEGVNTAKAVHLLSEKMGVNMPICKVIYEVLYEDKGIDIAIHELMNRPRKHEFMEMMEI
ncbi:NAD(P)H-dependent glycerol-3-phosphate dehydrogenase [Ezakiella peruensis]|uniref:NAD(P)H-dependent glycerol-3-phosphate dehydrogenase n=1 Tax=Ezakiella peruensis TaxID=1464038 RepID=UPI000C1B5A1C|nr:NAD(P)H-dependent glycerol-3-phosphate dehydrogenase [Ezakiella peruensis]